MHFSSLFNFSRRAAAELEQSPMAAAPRQKLSNNGLALVPCANTRVVLNFQGVRIARLILRTAETKKEKGKNMPDSNVVYISV